MRSRPAKEKGRNCKRNVLLTLTFGVLVPLGLLGNGRTLFISNAGEKSGQQKGHTVDIPSEEITKADFNFQKFDAAMHLQCATPKNSWHLALVWGHGVANYSDILNIIKDSLPDIRIPYQKIVHNIDLGGLVKVAYSDDVARIGKEHIDAKTEYMKSVPNTLAVLILVDPAPDMQSHGDGHMAINVNSRLVDVKWDIRQRFNPKLSEDAQRDSHGVFSHHHVIHVTDSSDGVDDVLQYLGQPSIARLNRTGNEISIPWHLESNSFAVEAASLKSLKIRCAVSSRKCTKGSTISISESPHYAFVTGNEEDYVEYYLKGRAKGILTDDHTPLAFTRLKGMFTPQQYPMCVCESDGNLRRSLLIVDAENVILDGAHRAALLLANGFSENVLVARWGAYGAKAEPCVVKDRVNLNDESWPRYFLTAWIQALQQEVNVVFLKAEVNLIEDFEIGGDVDIVVDSIVQAIKVVRRLSFGLEIRVSYLHNRSQAHVDAFNGKDFVRLDLYEKLFEGNEFIELPEISILFAEARRRDISSGISLRVPSLEHECTLRWLEWKSFSKTRPEKIKHLKWNRANFCSEELQENSVTACLIEVPKGSIEKVEITGASRQLAKPMVANYGFIPDTLVAKDKAWSGIPGDGDPLDCLVLGEPLTFNSTLNIRVLGVLNMVDNGETDWKILGAPLSNSDAEEEVIWEELERWFSEYKEGVEVSGHASLAKAISFIRQTESLFAKRELNLLADSSLPRI